MVGSRKRKTLLARLPLRDMTVGVILEIIAGVLKFPDAVLRLIRALSKTDQQKHDDILKAAEDAARKFEEEGRPTW